MTCRFLRATAPFSPQQAPDRVTAPSLQKHDDSKRKGHEELDPMQFTCSSFGQPGGGGDLTFYR